MSHKKTEYKINIANPLHLLVYEIDGFVEEKEGSKYLNISHRVKLNTKLKN